MTAADIEDTKDTKGNTTQGETRHEGSCRSLCARKLLLLLVLLVVVLPLRVLPMSVTTPAACLCCQGNPIADVSCSLLHHCLADTAGCTQQALCVRLWW